MKIPQGRLQNKKGILLSGVHRVKGSLLRTLIRVAPKQKPQHSFTPGVPGKGVLQRCPLCAHMLWLPQFPFANYRPERRKCPLWIDRTPLREICKFAYYPYKGLKYYKTQDYPIPFPRCKNKNAPSHLYTPNTPAKHQQHSTRTNRYPPTFYPSIPFPPATHTLGKSRGAEKVGWFPSSFALRRQLRKAPARY